LGCPDRVLPLNVASIDVFRAAVVSIVLTLTLGQNASVLCRIWCHPAADAASASCEHQNVGTSPGVTGSDRCTQSSAGATAFIREDLRRGGSATDADHSVVVAQFRLAPPATPSSSRRFASPLRRVRRRSVVSPDSTRRSQRDLSFSPSESKSRRRGSVPQRDHHFPQHGNTCTSVRAGRDNADSM
jgi:hypothetical protein